MKLWSCSRLTIILPIIIVGAFLRFYQIGSQSIWYDEGYSIAFSNQSFAYIVSNMEANHLPFYFLLLRGWMLLAGQSEVTVRLLSLIPGVLAIPLAYVVGKKLFNAWVGTVLAALCAISPFLIHYSQETRMYSLMVAQALLTTYFLLRALDGDKRFWVGYALATGSLLYTHYYSLLFAMTQGLFVALWMASKFWGRGIRSTAHNLLPWLAAEVGIALLFLPWALQRSQVFETSISAAKDSVTLASILSRSLIGFSLGHSVEALNANPTDPGYSADHNLAMWLGAGFLLIIFLGLVLAIAGKSSPGSVIRPLWQQKAIRSLVLVVTLLVVTTIAAYAITMNRQGFAPRYLILLAPFFYLLVACGLYVFYHKSRPLLIAAAVFLLVTTGLSLNNYYTNPKYSRDDFRSVAAYLTTNSQTDAAIICNASYSRDALGYYYKESAPLVPLPAEYPPDKAKTESELRGLCSEYEYLWLELWQDYYSDPGQYVERWLDQHAFIAEEKSFHGKIRLKGYYTNAPIANEDSIPNNSDQHLGDELRLVGFEVEPLRAGQEGKIVLYWQALAPIQKDYTVFVHLLSQNGDKWAQHDSQPWRGSFPTTKWAVGQIVRDEHIIAVPAYAPPIDYRLEIGMYELATLQHLGAPDKDRVMISPASVLRGTEQETALPNHSEVSFGNEIVMRGYAFSSAQRGDTVSLDLYWRAVSAVSTDLSVFVHVVDSNGLLVVQADGPPAGGIYPTSQWQPGETIFDPRSFSLPTDLPAGKYEVQVGLYNPASGKRLTAKSGWWNPASDKFTVGTISLE